MCQLLALSRHDSCECVLECMMDGKIEPPSDTWTISDEIRHRNPLEMSLWYFENGRRTHSNPRHMTVMMLTI